MDYKALLKKYMGLVATNEGVTFTGGPRGAWAIDNGISEEEWAELQRLASDISALDTP